MKVGLEHITYDTTDDVTHLDDHHIVDFGDSFRHFIKDGQLSEAARCTIIDATMDLITEHTGYCIEDCCPYIDLT